MRRPASRRPRAARRRALRPASSRLLRRPFRGGAGPVEWLIVGLGNPGREYRGTRHNIGCMVAAALAERWGLPRPRERYRGLLSEGRVRARDDREAASAAVRVALLCPQTYMNEAGRSVGPARGALRIPLERVLVIHDEIDLPFGEVRTRHDGGLAGHNGLKSLRRELGGAGFTRVRVGVGRPDSTDPEIVSAYVLARFSEPREEVQELIERACERVEELVLGAQAAQLLEQDER